MTHTLATHRQRGASLIELLIAVGITMFLVSAAAYVYLLTRESQGVSERTSARDEIGAFALQLLGREIMNAGFYPATMPPPPPLAPASPVTQRQVNTVSGYPPAASIPTAKPTDWTAPHVNYLHAIYGCEGSKFDHVTATCGAVDNTLPDSIVINYFTSESKDEAATMGQRRDCTGADVGNDDKATQFVNRVRKLNSPTPIPAAGIVALTEDATIAPQQPLFVSNRYGLNATNIVVNVGMKDQGVTTQSLACSGNGSSFFGTANTTAYQPILAGIDDMQLTYGVFNTESTRAPDRFYRADQVNALGNIAIAGVTMGPWERVVAVRVCLMTSTLGGSTKIADKTGALRTYLNCADQPITQLATDLSLHKRHVQIFGVRNRLNQGF